MKDKERFLIENENLIWYAVKKHRPWFIEHEDAFQELSMIMLKLLDTFDKEEGEFSTYFMKSAKLWCYNKLKMESRYKENESNLSTLEIDINLLKGETKDPLSVVLNQEIKEELKMLLKKHDNRNVLERYILKGESLKKIAEDLLISKQRVEQIKKNALNKIRKEVEDGKTLSVLDKAGL